MDKIVFWVLLLVDVIGWSIVLVALKRNKYNKPNDN